MKRRLAAALLIITLPLGMAACHGSKSRKATPSTPAPAATANANPTQAPGQAPGQAPAQPQAPMPTQAPLPSNQSVDEACNIVAGGSTASTTPTTSRSPWQLLRTPSTA